MVTQPYPGAKQERTKRVCDYQKLGSLWAILTPDYQPWVGEREAGIRHRSSAERVS